MVVAIDGPAGAGKSSVGGGGGVGGPVSRPPSPPTLVLVPL